MGSSRSQLGLSAGSARAQRGLSTGSAGSGHLVERGAEAVHDRVHLSLRDHEGRRELERMPAQDTSRDAVSIGCGDQAIRDAGVSGERFRLDRDCGRHPDRSNIANERPPGQAAERRRDLRLHRLHPSYEALGFEDVEIGKRGGRGPGVARIG